MIVLRRPTWILLFAFCVVPILRGQLRAGVARADITPPVGQYDVLASGKQATAVRDPLYAKVILFETDEARVAVVSLDLDASFPPELFDYYRRRLKQEANIDYVALTASHTHSSIDLETNAGEMLKWPWTFPAMDKIYFAILQAHRDAVPVRIRVGYGSSNIGTNRRLVKPGGVETLGRGSPNKPDVQPSDHRVGVLRVDRLDGSALAVVVHYACHPVALMADDSVSFSADYVGEMENEVARRVLGAPEVLFWQGASGDINLRDSITGSGEPEVKRYGHELADAVVTARNAASDVVDDTVSYRTASLDMPSRWSPEAVAEAGRGARSIDRWLVLNYHPVYVAPLGTVLLGKQVALALLPGEPFIDFQFRIDAASPVKNTWIVGYCERTIGYVPTIRAAAEGGYGGDGPETLTQVGSGDRMVDWATIQLYDQLGLFHALPSGVPGKRSRPAPK